MTNIKKVFASNLKKHRLARGWTQGELAEECGSSCQYIGALETQGKFPSPDMIQKLAAALKIDPTELFCKELDLAETIKNIQKATIEGVGEEVNRLLADFFARKMRKLDEEGGEKQA
jgi:transcriptional regulator with XRE-family HTH domain